jgi:pimeloyl-ACP methyl ester carboxylesterase
MIAKATGTCLTEVNDMVMFARQARFEKGQRHFLIAPALLLISLAGCQKNPAQAPMPEQPSMMAVTDVDFMADDGLTVTGRFYRATKPKALILLFHQANSSKDEYATIAPKLVEIGYSALAIDQRSGGAMFGKNMTASRLQTPVTYGDALHDLDAALGWGRTMHMPILIWGSSYSSALAFELAAKHPKDIAAVLAFSPGEYLGSGNPVAAAATKVLAPVYISVGGDPSELRKAKPVFDAVAASKKVLHIPKAGVHGSSTLITDRNPSGAAANWTAVEKFLDNIDLVSSAADTD